MKFIKLAKGSFDTCQFHIKNHSCKSLHIIMVFICIVKSLDHAGFPHVIKFYYDKQQKRDTTCLRQVKSSQVSFICVSPVCTLKHILHIKLTYTYTTAILKELRETIKVTVVYIHFKKLYTHEMTYKHMGPARSKTVLELSLY